MLSAGSLGMVTLQLMKITRRSALLAASGALLVPAVSFAGAHARFAVEEIEIEMESLDPAHDGLRLVQLSDIHVGAFTEDEQIISAVRAVVALAPDLIVLTGDFVTVKHDPFERVGELLAALPDVPKVAVLGNHDHWTHPVELKQVLQHANIEVLQNENTELRLNHSAFRIIGVDDGYTKHDDATEALKGVPTNGSRLILTHTPSAANRIPPLGLLCLSGHTHGGHFVVPGLTDAILHVAGQPYVRGRYEANGNHLYVNRGLGAGRTGHLPRVNSMPEVSLFTLRRSAA